MVKYLTDNKGRLNGLNVKLCISNETFNQAITTFVKLNNELSDKVVKITEKPVDIQGEKQLTEDEIADMMQRNACTAQ